MSATSTRHALPFVKWAGGKTQLLDSLLPLCPPKFEGYYEPFLGGGALFFALARAGGFDHAVLNDLNTELITAYRVIQTELEDLIEVLSDLEGRFKAAESQSEFYYTVRGQKPTSNVEIAGRFIFLNKTCYNGLYRVNKSGQFNVPFGRYKNPSIFDKKNLKAASEALKSVELRAEPFETALASVGPGDLVYFDPPYQPISRTSNFTGYTAGRFNVRDQEALAAEFHRLDRLGAYVMLSNSDHAVVENLYSGNGYDIRYAAATRQINSVATKRGPVPELIVRNYR